jgi:hypothetical protein
MYLLGLIEYNMTQLQLGLSCISIRLAAKLALCAQTKLRRSGSEKEGVRPFSGGRFAYLQCTEVILLIFRRCGLGFLKNDLPLNAYRKPGYRFQDSDIRVLNLNNGLLNSVSGVPNPDFALLNLDLGVLDSDSLVLNRQLAVQNFNCYCAAGFSVPFTFPGNRSE